MSADRKLPNRRQFLSAAGLMGAGAVLASCAPAVAAPPAKANIDLDVLNFALNLEYLEAAFYTAAVGRLAELKAIGGGADVILTGTGFDGTTNTFTDPNSPVAQYAAEIAQDELNHVKFLYGALGANAVARPVLDIGPAFVAAANAAAMGAGLATPLAPGFNPYSADLYFLHGAFIFEDVGVTAYKGAARLITNPDYLEAAAGILAVEAYHAGEVRTQLYAQRAAPTGYGVNVAQLIGAISALRASVGGGKDQGITSDNTATGAANIVPTDANSIAFSRSTAEVLPIVYLGGAGKGGFFPNGLNGNIK
ncbi:ferritin-like domain-containing protein [Deinococcus rubellus]|uniref:Ferritin-like domain-containing protein n=1 Tax=Deinococcus rubellus TaxID=1889240 RepID=A0ABY5YJ96_9DEIO|nr:ferritin-like domain-containing protein [Deinococcus rubellus]UWX63863.1 ferritin-like domain-containing protein [Deinococcus rubellus]